MKTLPRLFFLIPVLNESPNIPRLLGNLQTFSQDLQSQFQCRVVFIDDGSTDDTAQRIEEGSSGMDVEVLKHPRNQGPGAAFATGFRYLAAILQEPDWVVTLEGDNTSRIQTLHQMLTRRLEGFEVVLASPYAYGGGITKTSWIRIFLSHAANTLIKELLGIHGILTMSSFFRLYNGPVLKRLGKRYGSNVLETRGFECMVELLAKLIKVNATISEVAMPLDGAQRLGKSKMKVFRTIRGYFKVFWICRRWD